MNLRLPLLFLGFAFVATTSAQVRITEWMYSGTASPSNTTSSEYIEITNVGTSSVDLTGWTYDDSNRTDQAATSLTGLGSLAAGQSGLITEATAADFRSLWGLPLTTAIVGGNTNNIGRSDTINIFNASGNTIDTLVYNDQGAGTVKGPRTQNVSGNILRSNLGQNNASTAVLSSLGDSFGSRQVGNLIGNPGVYPAQATPEPSAFAALGVGAIALLRRRRKA